MSDYDPPSPDEFRQLLQTLALSRGQAGKLADVTGNRVGKWCSAGGGTVPFSVLFTIVSRHLNIRISPLLWRDELANI
jgi:hypothetical protein